jgi:carbonic anhydrase
MVKPYGLYPLQQVIWPNPAVKEAPCPFVPCISEHSVIGAGSMVIGNVTVSDHVFIGFHNIIRADASLGPYWIGPYTNIQDFVLMHCHPGETIDVGGYPYGVYIGEQVSILHHAAVHGPLYVGSHTLIGQHASIYGASIGRGCVIMHGAVVTNKVTIPDGRFVAPGQAVWKQEDADALPPVPEAFKGLNAQVVDFYFRAGKAYQRDTPLAF